MGYDKCPACGETIDEKSHLCRYTRVADLDGEEEGNDESFFCCPGDPSDDCEDGWERDCVKFTGYEFIYCPRLHIIQQEPEPEREEDEKNDDNRADVLRAIQADAEYGEACR